MNPSKTRKTFRPALESMEAKALTSAGLSAQAAKVKPIVVNLKSTQVGVDALNALTTAAPTAYRQSITIQSLVGNGKNGKVSGTAVGVYNVPTVGIVLARVTFDTKLANPRPSDVKISLGKLSSFVTASDRAKVGAAVVNFLKADRAAILALEYPKV